MPLLLLPITATAVLNEPAVLTGTFTDVRDGDTIELGKIPIRLRVVSETELDELFGNASKLFMFDLIYGTSVHFELTGAIPHERLVGNCYSHGEGIGIFN